MAEPQTLPALIRAKYPGVYDDLSDNALDASVRAKYPGVYDDIPKPSTSPNLMREIANPEYGKVLTEGPEAPQTLLNKIAGNPLLWHAAYPQSIGDMLPLLIPAGVTTAIAAAKGYGSAAKEALSTTPNLRSLPTQMLKILANRASAPALPTGVNRYAPSLSGYRRGPVPAAPGEAIPGSHTYASPIEPYSPSVSGYRAGATVGEAPGQASPNLQGPPQATYVLRPGASQPPSPGDWHIEGMGLKEGETVNVTNREGNATLHRVGKIISDQQGVQRATIANTKVGAPTAVIERDPVTGQWISPTRYREMLQQFGGTGKP